MKLITQLMPTAYIKQPNPVILTQQHADMRISKHAAGFTLLEMVIVMVLVGITAVFGSRFIADMASTQVGTVERSHALSGARFAMERMRRELSRAYSPSVYISEAGQCVSFVPAKAAGTYYGQVKDASARFMIPVSLHGKPLKESNIAVAATNGQDNWQFYPTLLPNENVAQFIDFDVAPNKGTLEGDTAAPGLVYSEAIKAGTGDFSFDNAKQRFTLLTRRQIRYCLESEQLYRSVKEDENWSTPILMLSGVKSKPLFSHYNGSLQLLTLNLTLSTREGDLVLPSQLQVNYEP